MLCNIDTRRYEVRGAHGWPNRLRIVIFHGNKCSDLGYNKQIVGSDRLSGALVSSWHALLVGVLRCMVPGKQARRVSNLTIAI